MLENINLVIELWHEPLVAPFGQRARAIHKAFAFRPVDEQRCDHNFVLTSTCELLSWPDLLTIGIIDIKVAKFVVFGGIADGDQFVNFVDVQGHIRQRQYW